MGSAGHLRVTAAVTVLGAGVLVAAPVAPPADIAVPAIELVASPLDPYVDLITNTFNNLGTIGTHWLEDPLPTVVQFAVNWVGYLQTTTDAFTAAWQSFVDGLSNLPDQLETLFGAVSDGDFEAVLAQSIIIVLSVFPVPALVDHLLSIPYAVVGNFVNAAMATLHALQVPVGVAALSALQATVTEVEVVAHDFVDALAAGDFTGALVQLIGAPAGVLNAMLNSESPGLAGLLAPFQDVHQSGFLDALVNYLPRDVAESIGALHAPINDDPLPVPPEPDAFDLGDSGDLGALLPDA